MPDYPTGLHQKTSSQCRDIALEHVEWALGVMLRGGGCFGFSALCSFAVLHNLEGGSWGLVGVMGRLPVWEFKVLEVIRTDQPSG